MGLDMEQVEEQLKAMTDFMKDSADEDPSPNFSPRGRGMGLDDFTAIEGVGPRTASKLHNAGLYTYEDIRAFLMTGERIPGISLHTMNLIAGWLYDRLV